MKKQEKLKISQEKGDNYSDLWVYWTFYLHQYIEKHKVSESNINQQMLLLLQMVELANFQENIL